LRFETERLVVRAFHDGDVDALHAYRNDPETARFQSWDAPYPREKAVAAVAEMVGAPALRRGDWTQLAIETRSQPGLIGDIGVRLDADGRAGEIGYTFAPAARGRGYAREAVAAVLEYLFGPVVGVERVEAWADVDNVRSRRLLEAVGFTLAGVDDGEAHYARPPL
jgi:RimJ/RimL family protein N-acetyltransferase